MSESLQQPEKASGMLAKETLLSNVAYLILPAGSLSYDNKSLPLFTKAGVFVNMVDARVSRWS